MNIQSWIANLQWGMEMLPFPALLLYVIVAGMLWLLIEAILTRTARATPKWRRPFPILPIVSEVAAWLTRGSSWLLWTWAILYFALVAVHWVSAQGSPEWAGASETMMNIARDVAAGL